MRSLLLCLLFAAIFYSGSARATAQIEEFTYQGHLQFNGQPATGTFPMTFALFDASSGGNQVGSTVNKNSVNVDGGAFTVNLSFPDAFAGQQLWLEFTVNGQTLSSRQTVTAAPVAQFALDAANGARALSYENQSPSTAMPPPKTVLADIASFTISTSCGIDLGSGAVTSSIFVDSTGTYDVELSGNYQTNDTGAINAVATHGSSVTGPATLYFSTVGTGSYRRYWFAPILLRSTAAPLKIVSLSLYMVLDANVGSTQCKVWDTATSGV